MSTTHSEWAASRDRAAGELSGPLPGVPTSGPLFEALLAHQSKLMPEPLRADGTLKGRRSCSCPGCKATLDKGPGLVQGYKNGRKQLVRCDGCNGRGTVLTPAGLYSAGKLEVLRLAYDYGDLLGGGAK